MQIFIKMTTLSDLTYLRKIDNILYNCQSNIKSYVKVGVSILLYYATSLYFVMQTVVILSIANRDCLEEI